MEKNEKDRIERIIRNSINLFILRHDGKHYDIGYDLASNICDCIRGLNDEIIQGVMDNFAEGL